LNTPFLAEIEMGMVRLVQCLAAATAASPARVKAERIMIVPDEALKTSLRLVPFYRTGSPLNITNQGKKIWSLPNI
jgi:hypothetical protein